MTAGRKLLVASVGFLGLGLVATPANASPVETDTGSSTGFTVSSTDLINGIAPSAISGTQDQEGLGSDTTGKVLTDGAFGDPGLGGTPGNYLTIVNNGASITYTLPSASTINEIDTYSGWRDNGRSQQNYTVSVSSDGGNTYTPLTTVNSIVQNSSPSDIEVALTDTTGTLATGVTNIKFDFPSTQNGYVGYHEIDVFGSAAASTPLPASAWGGLALLGGLGLTRLRRKTA